jgi:hypothetical protein
MFLVVIHARTVPGHADARACWEFVSTPWVEPPIEEFFLSLLAPSARKKLQMMHTVTYYRLTRAFFTLKMSYTRKVIAFKPTRKVWPSYPKVTDARQHYVQSSRAECHPDRPVDVYKPPPHPPCPVNGRLLHRMLLKWDEGYRKHGQVLFASELEYRFQCGDIHKAHACSRTLRVAHLPRIVPKFVNNHGKYG